MANWVNGSQSVGLELPGGREPSDGHGDECGDEKAGHDRGDKDLSPALGPEDVAEHRCGHQRFTATRRSRTPKANPDGKVKRR